MNILNVCACQTGNSTSYCKELEAQLIMKLNSSKKIQVMESNKQGIRIAGSWEPGSWRFFQVTASEDNGASEQSRATTGR